MQRSSQNHSMARSPYRGLSEMRWPKRRERRGIFTSAARWMTCEISQVLTALDSLPTPKRYVKAARLANHRVPKAILLWSRTGNTILLSMGGSSPDRRTCRSFTSSYTPHKLCARLRRPDNFVQTIAKLEPKCVSKRLPRSLVEYRGKIFPMYAPNFFGL